MAAVDFAHIEAQNMDAYDDLIVTVSASDGALSLFLAVCDDAAFREEIIQRYEAELAPDIPAYRAMISQDEPSLWKALATVVEREPRLQAGARGVITVLGADSLLPLILGDESRSQQSQFLGYLQWTRESLREFKYPIILWVSSRLLAAVGQKAPDFWGWRKDVFWFKALPRMVPVKDAMFERLDERQFGIEDDDDELPIEELLKLVEEREHLENAKDDPILATLYVGLGKAYKHQSERRGAAAYKSSVAEAIAWYNKAVQLQTLQDSDPAALATTLNNLANLYRSQGKYREAEPLFLEALAIARASLPPNHPHLAAYLGSLAGLYKSQGNYGEAEPLYLEALGIDRASLPPNHPDLATHLNNLAGLYKSQGKYGEAEPLYLEALGIDRASLPSNHPDLATDLNNLAGLYYAQEKYVEAEPLFLDTATIFYESLGADHPNTQTILKNLVIFYRTALAAGLPDTRLRAHPLSDAIRSRL